MTEFEKANIRLLVVNFALMWKEATEIWGDELGDWDFPEVDANIKQVCKTIHTNPSMLGWSY